MTIAQNQTANDAFDAFDAAMTVHKNEYIQFCEITIIDPWYCVLEKGVGKRKFNPDEDNISLRRTSIDIVCVPIRMNENGTTYDVRQSAIDTSKDWQKVTLPSIRNLGLNLRSMIGAFVKLKKTATGGDLYQQARGEEGKDRDRIPGNLPRSCSVPSSSGRTLCAVQEARER